MNRRDQQRFDEIRHRLERASPGPHTVVNDTEIVAMAGAPGEETIADTCWSPSIDQDKANAEFFAHSHEDITWLTERVRDLERAAKGKG